jgi:hypothetical protein
MPIDFRIDKLFRIFKKLAKRVSKNYFWLDSLPVLLKKCAENPNYYYLPPSRVGKTMKIIQSLKFQ